jgi:hypothetical protein
MKDVRRRLVLHMEKQPINILALIRITVNGIMILKKLPNLYKWSVEKPVKTI